jgi:hypothetical protein
MLIASSVLLIGTAIGLIYYWIDFYIRGGVQAVNEDWYARFQKAFTVADLWTAACALAGLLDCWRDKHTVYFLHLSPLVP